MFAHHQYELKFAMELKAKRRILKDVLKAVDKKLAGDQVKTAWNPGGGTFTDCIGCGEDVLLLNTFDSSTAPVVRVSVVPAKCVRPT
jgi:hypothetical protein